MFMDLYKGGLLPVAVTPNELLMQLGEMYSQGRDYHRHMEQVEKAFNKAYNPSKPV